jgi:transcriptional regulator with XRE-family HTH domain
MRALAREVGVSDSFLSRALRGVDYKSASGELTGRVARALGLPVDYFREYREDRVVDRVRADARLRDDIYDRFERRRRG